MSIALAHIHFSLRYRNIVTMLLHRILSPLRTLQCWPHQTCCQYGLVLGSRPCPARRHVRHQRRTGDSCTCIRAQSAAPRRTLDVSTGQSSRITSVFDSHCTKILRTACNTLASLWFQGIWTRRPSPAHGLAGDGVAAVSYLCCYPLVRTVTSSTAFHDFSSENNSEDHSTGCTPVELPGGQRVDALLARFAQGLPPSQTATPSVVQNYTGLFHTSLRAMSNYRYCTTGRDVSITCSKKCSRSDQRTCAYSHDSSHFAAQEARRAP